MLFESLSRLPFITVAPLPRPLMPLLPSYEFIFGSFHDRLPGGLMFVTGISSIVVIAFLLFLRKVYAVAQKKASTLRIEEEEAMQSIEEQAYDDDNCKRRKITFSSQVGKLPTIQVYRSCAPTSKRRKASPSFSKLYSPQTDGYDRYRRAQSAPLVGQQYDV
jgi:hypothetical protein